MNPLQPIADELRPILARVRAAKETLGNGGLDCSYTANKQLETVVFCLSDLIEQMCDPRNVGEPE